MCKISIIIPIYNTGNCLRRCLDSVINQTLQEIEIICVNDGSTDNSLAILKEYETEDRRIKIIDFARNKGVSAARNAGIKAAEGEYIGFCDSDDYVDLNFYEKLYTCAAKTGADIIKSNLRFIRCDNSYIATDILAQVKQNKIAFEYIPTAIFKSNFLKENSLCFREDILGSEDCVFEVHAAILCNKIEICEDTFYNYVRRDYSLNHAEEFDEVRIINCIKSAKAVFDILNNADIDKETYLLAAIMRHGHLFKWAFQKAKDDKCRKMIADAQSEIHVKYKNDFDVRQKQILEAKAEAERQKAEEEKRKAEEKKLKAEEQRKKAIFDKLRKRIANIKISVIIPVYNVEPYLKRCLDSVINQTLKDIEIICINDRSTDNSLEILREYAAEDRRIKIINFEENKGVANARNAGLETARGEYLGFVDSDDEIALDFYEKLYACAKFEDADITKGYCRTIQLNGDVKISNLNEIIRKNSTKFAFTYEWVTAIYRASFVYDNNIKFPAEYLKAEDTVFLNRCVIKAKNLILVDDACYYYHKRKGSLDAEKISLEHIKSSLNARKLILNQLNFVPADEIDKKDYTYFLYLSDIILYISSQNDTLECKQMCAQSFAENYHKCKNKAAIDENILKSKFARLLPYVKDYNVAKIAIELKNGFSQAHSIAANLRKKVVKDFEHV